MTLEEAGKILAHQLEGIMFHADAMSVAALNGYERLKRLHHYQALAETEIHLLTVNRLISDLDEMIHPVDIQRIVISDDASRAEIMEKWLDWEERSKKMYLMLMEEYPRCKLWGKLFKDTVEEMTKINHYI